MQSLRGFVCAEEDQVFGKTLVDTVSIATRDSEKLRAGWTGSRVAAKSVKIYIPLLFQEERLLECFDLFNEALPGSRTKQAAASL